MTLLDYTQRKVPDYYPDMWRDGFNPYEVMTAFKKQMWDGIEDNQMASEIKISSEVKVK